jgi:hypothetical protein
VGGYVSLASLKKKKIKKPDKRRGVRVEVITTAD